jgi:glycosyltransferase involved in cell wall biosynthesis
MRLLYLCDSHIPSRATSGMQIMRMCSAFQQAGAEVTMVRPYRLGNRPEGYNGDLWQFYGVSPRFEVRTLPTLQTLRLAQMRWLSRALRFGPLASFVLARSRPGGKPFTCYSRSMLASWLMIKLRRFWGRRSACRGVFIELHDHPVSPRMQGVLAEADGIVAISHALRDRLILEIPEVAHRVWVEHDGVDVQVIRPDLLDREHARHRLGLDGTRGPVVLYTGRAIAGKGVDVLLASAPILEKVHAQVVIVGRVYEDQYLDQASALGSVTLVGFKPPAEVPDYLAAADILVLPTTSDLPYAAYTSPLKLFEYMASGRPIVASDLPVLREVLEDQVNALLFPPHDAAALAGAVERLWHDVELRRRLADQAWADVQSYSWNERATRILQRMNMGATP